MSLEHSKCTFWLSDIAVNTLCNFCFCFNSSEMLSFMQKNKINACKWHKVPIYSTLHCLWLQVIKSDSWDAILQSSNDSELFWKLLYHLWTILMHTKLVKSNITSFPLYFLIIYLMFTQNLMQVQKFFCLGLWDTKNHQNTPAC